MYIDKRNFEPHASKNFHDLDKFEIFECAEHYLNEAINASDSKTIVECLCYVVRAEQFNFSNNTDLNRLTLH